MSRLVALIGPPGCGKTTVCARLADAARARGMRVAGIISPGAEDDPSGRRSRMVVDLATGAARPLGRRTKGTEGTWDLDEEALAWGAGAALDGAAAGADLLIIDELGRLELREGRGWGSCLGLLRDGIWQLAVASVREEYLDAFKTRLGAAASRLEVVRVHQGDREDLPARLLGACRDR